MGSSRNPLGQGGGGDPRAAFGSPRHRQFLPHLRHLLSHRHLSRRPCHSPNFFSSHSPSPRTRTSRTFPMRGPYVFQTSRTRVAYYPVCVPLRTSRPRHRSREHVEPTCQIAPLIWSEPDTQCASRRASAEIREQPRQYCIVSYITPGHSTDHSAYTVHMITHMSVTRNHRPRK